MADHGRGLRVLIVEDSLDDTALLLRELERAGYEVVHERVDNATALDAALASAPWDLVISDHSMPGFTGVAALEHVRRLDPDVPFIFVSGTIGEDVAVDAMRIGAHDYVLKGDLRRLVPAIQRELRDAHVRRERRRAEEALRASEERFRKVFQFSPVGIAISTLDEGILLEANDAYLAMIGHGRAEAIGKSARELSVWRDPAELRELVKMVQEHGSQHGIDKVIWNKRGEARHVLASLDLLAIGGEQCLLALVLDVTEHRRLEQWFHQAQKMEAVGRLAGGVAHDFNNLLTVITTCTDLVLEDAPAEDPRRGDLEEVRKAAAAAAALTRQLLAFSRQQVLQPQTLDLNDVLAGVEQMLKRLIREDIDLVTVPGPDLWLVTADLGQLEQVIVNLVVNARDAMPQGGKLTLETANTEMDDAYVREHAYARPGQYAMLSVTDTGVGMDAATRARVFEPFFTTKQPGHGTGLGLATVYGIVKQSGGFIWVYSEPGHGAAFKVYLPRAEAPARPGARPASPAGTVKGGTETILLVEDAAALRAAARQVLERQGYAVIEAADGEAAIGVAAAHSGVIDLLLTDVVMPKLSGRELAERLSAQRPGLRVLFTSGYSDEAVVRHGEIRPGAGYLQKPFTPDGLARKVREVLDTTLHPPS